MPHIYIYCIKVVKEGDEVGMVLRHGLCLGMFAPDRLMEVRAGDDRVLYMPRRKSSLMRSSVCAESTSACRSM